MSWKRT